MFGYARYCSAERRPLRRRFRKVIDHAMVVVSDKWPRLLLALYWSITAGLLTTVICICLVVQAYVPPQDIAAAAPIPFFETIKPAPFFGAILGAVLTSGAIAGVFLGRSLRRW